MCTDYLYSTIRALYLNHACLYTFLLYLQWLQFWLFLFDGSTGWDYLKMLNVNCFKYFTFYVNIYHTISMIIFVFDNGFFSIRNRLGYYLFQSIAKNVLLYSRLGKTKSLNADYKPDTFTIYLYLETFSDGVHVWYDPKSRQLHHYFEAGRHHIHRLALRCGRE